MRIDINERYCITSDSDQYYISTKHIQKVATDGQSVSDEFKERLKHIAYVRTLSQCYTFLLQRQIRESPAVGFAQIMQEVKRIEDELKQSIKI